MEDKKAGQTSLLVKETVINRPNEVSVKFIKLLLTNLKKHMDRNTIIERDSNSLLSALDSNQLNTSVERQHP